MADTPQQDQYLSEYELAFHVLLDRCLGLTAGDTLLTIHDETVEPFLPALTARAEALKINLAPMSLPLADQLDLLGASRGSPKPSSPQLPRQLLDAISHSTSIINALGGNPRTASVRRAINHTPRPARCRLATIPGITSDVLRAIARAPYSQILTSCEEVAWALGDSASATIATIDPHGRAHRLTLGLGGWDSEPIMSPGLLLPDSWGNVPPGETFCCPDPGSVHGSIVIDGSIPGRALEPGESAVLVFESGRLVDVQAPLGSYATTFFDSQRAAAQGTGDEAWDVFSELGVGLNPIITALTGNALFDEKALGTLHVAIGDNTNFGHDNPSDVHFDMVTRRPTLLVGDLELLSGGTLHVDALRARRNTEIPALSPTTADTPLVLRRAQIDIHDGRVMRRLSAAQRINFVDMAPPALQPALRHVYDALLPSGAPSASQFISKHPLFEGIPTERLLGILDHYRTLRRPSSRLSPHELPRP